MNPGELYALAFFCASGGLLVGAYARRTRERTIDRLARTAFFGRAPELAWALTRLGYSPALAGLFFLLGVIEVAATRRITFVVVLIAAQLASQQAVNAVKRQFKRRRPANWLKREELTHAFPSGHATTAVVVFGTLFRLVGDAHLGPEALIALRCALGFVIVGLGWSRMALGAHHCTDVIGGYLFGSAVLCLLLSVMPAVLAR